MTIATSVGLAVLSLVPLLVSSGASSSSQVIGRTVYLMGTRASLFVRATDRVAALQQLELMVRSLERTEAELSTWRSDSTLGAVNRLPVGEAVELPAPVCALWGELTAWYRLTDGTFDPAVGALSEAWGLREDGRPPFPGDVAAARAVTGWNRFRFERPTCRLTRLVDVTLDAGGFGKGEALRRLLQLPPGGGAWMVDLGGQIAVSGGSPAGMWTVGLAHPARRAEPAMEIALADGSLATSGASERSFEVEGRLVAHILDPRTGQPLDRPESVTVWHEDALAADVLSTALYVMGVEAGLRYADDHGFAALFLAVAGGGRGPVTLRASLAFRQRFPVVCIMERWIPERSARLVRRDEGAYRQYSTDEQHRPDGISCPESTSHRLGTGHLVNYVTDDPSPW